MRSCLHCAAPIAPQSKGRRRRYCTDRCRRMAWEAAYASRNGMTRKAVRYWGQR